MVLFRFGLRAVPYDAPSDLAQEPGRYGYSLPVRCIR
jgi:hypothetical protein